jgi:anti-anti-sigma factor
MEMTLADIGDKGVKITLRGRLDTPGVTQIETRFAAAATRNNALVDLSNVSFLASLGIGMLIGAARAVKKSGHTIVLYGAPERVIETLQSAGLAQILPVAADETTALRLLADAPCSGCGIGE